MTIYVNLPDEATINGLIKLFSQHGFNIKEKSIELKNKGYKFCFIYLDNQQLENEFINHFYNINYPETNYQLRPKFNQPSSHKEIDHCAEKKDYDLVTEVLEEFITILCNKIDTQRK
ncbi:MAG: hypothetical protein IGQ45_03965 [Cyanobacterium sp. T60_A2020_053]|nr:hypothetical protein [Cyanobacterium sp. T60_A2020_053]